MNPIPEESTVDEQDPYSQETWESTTGSQVWVNVRDPRVRDGWVQKSVGGKGSQRITITIEERQFNEEMVAYENLNLCPFRNGLLIRVLPKGTERSQFELKDEELLLLLQGGEDEQFEEDLAKISSEVILRRLLFLAERNATKWRYEMLDAAIRDRFPVGKASQVYREMEAEEARYAGTSF